MSLYPFLRSPFTELSGNFFNSQQRPDSMCAKIEMRLYDCMEAYGVDLARTKCMDLAMDLRECATRIKEDTRVQKMLTERHRQYYITGERKEHYEPPPKLNSW